MSEENVERFRQATRAFNRADAEAWLTFYDPNAVFEPQVAAMEGAYLGHDGIQAFLSTIFEVFEEFEVDLDEVRDVDDRVIAIGTARSVGRGSGIEQRAPIAVVATFENGRITHFKDYGERDRAIQAAGLSE